MVIAVTVFDVVSLSFCSLSPFKFQFCTVDGRNRTGLMDVATFSLVYGSNFWSYRCKEVRPKEQVLTRVLHVLCILATDPITEPHRKNMFPDCSCYSIFEWASISKKFLFSGKKTYQNLISTTVVFMRRCQGNIQSHGSPCSKIKHFHKSFHLAKTVLKGSTIKLIGK